MRATGETEKLIDRDCELVWCANHITYQRVGGATEICCSTYSVVMMGLRPSFFRFLLMAAVAASLLLLFPFAGPDPAAALVGDAGLDCCCTWLCA